MGHSLGGSVVSNYATWDFNGRPGADDLSGLVYNDGQAYGRLTSPAKASAGLASLDSSRASPFQYSYTTGLEKSLAGQLALMQPHAPSLLQQGGFGGKVDPPVPTTNLGFFGYTNNNATQPSSKPGNGAHLGAGLTPTGGWNGAGALTPIHRYARMLAGTSIMGADDAEWYFPTRLILDYGAPLGFGRPTRVQKILGLRATLGDRLPHQLRLYAFAAEKNKAGTLTITQKLASRSHIPRSHVTLVNRDRTYAHGDGVGASPKNAFLAHLEPFLRTIQNEN